MFHLNYVSPIFMELMFRILPSYFIKNPFVLYTISGPGSSILVLANSLFGVPFSASLRSGLFITIYGLIITYIERNFGGGYIAALGHCVYMSHMFDYENNYWKKK